MTAARMATVTRARVKPLSEQPDWVVCCDRIKSRFEDVGELYVYTDVFLATLTCRYCGAVRENTPCMKIARPHRGPKYASAIAVDCYELDEGVGELDVRVSQQ
jgi:hypothetical protein